MAGQQPESGAGWTRPSHAPLAMTLGAMAGLPIMSMGSGLQGHARPLAGLTATARRIAPRSGGSLLAAGGWQQAGERAADD
jgi:hypothetical protein